jgi:2-C-methyl-D-erythritol 4-phosphate cytidylyltransferase
MSAVAVIVAAGSGERFGNAAKVLVPLLGRPVLAWTLDAFSKSEKVSGIVIVVGPHTEAEVTELVANGGWPKVMVIVQGGDSRQHSMVNGVAAVPVDTEVVLVHDAARPLVQPGDIDACIDAAAEHGGAILAAPVTDTIKRVDRGRVAETVDRSTLWGAQTPQAFRADQMRAMAELAAGDMVGITDEASLAEHLGYPPVRIVVSDSTNLKLTHAHDLIFAEAILRARKEQS